MSKYIFHLAYTIIICKLITTALGAGNYSTTTTSTATDTTNIFKGPTITKPGCPSQCGTLTVPYPFGIGKGCGIGELFEFKCNTTFDPPQAFIGNIRIYEVSDNHMRISNVVAKKCYDSTGSVVLEKNASSSVTGTPYSYSDLNKFIVVGCDDQGYIFGLSGRTFINGCYALCSTREDVISGYCSGIGTK